ncbi:hypothetical protein D3C84_1054060 [compost metagenome]
MRGDFRGSRTYERRRAGEADFAIQVRHPAWAVRLFQRTYPAIRRWDPAALENGLSRRAAAASSGRAGRAARSRGSVRPSGKLGQGSPLRRIQPKPDADPAAPKSGQAADRRQPAAA